MKNGCLRAPWLNQYLIWLTIQILYSLVVVFAVGEIELFNKYFNHSVLWMCILSVFLTSYSVRLGLIITACAFVTTYFELFDKAHILIVEDILDLDYHRPQDGVVVAAAVVGIVSVYRYLRIDTYRTVFSTASLVLYFAFILFNVVVHFVFVGHVLPEMTNSRVIANQNVVTMDEKSFLGLCAIKGERGYEFGDDSGLPAWTCYSAPIDEALPDDLDSLGGVGSIHDHAQSNAGVAWGGWTSNYTDRSTIDSPLKHVAYYANGKSFNVLVDYTGFWTDKKVIQLGIYYFFAVFGVFWLWGGVLLLMLHQHRLGNSK